MEYLVEFNFTVAKKNSRFVGKSGSIAITTGLFIKNEVAGKIISELNKYCIKLDHKGLGLPEMDEVAFAEMEDIINQIINKK